MRSQVLYQAAQVCEADVCQVVNTCILELLNGGIVIVQDCGLRTTEPCSAKA